MKRRRLMGCIALLVALGIAWGCAKNPVTGKSELSLVSPDQELAMGKEGYPAVVAEFGLYEDVRLGAYVDSIGQALAKQSHQPELKWTFTLLDDPVVNAFAMPGGYIYITRGIMAHLNSEAQLAGVIGHEIGHVTARHSAQRMTQQQLAGLGLGLAGAFSDVFRRYGGAAQQALGLMFLKYGRDDENQSDELGVQYSTKANYDPREIPATYTMLKRVGERAGSTLPEFLSTHPDPGNREVRTAELAKAAVAGKSGLQIRQGPYLSRIDGVVYGEDPRQGFFEKSVFYHPRLGFEIAYPSGWTTRNGRSVVLAQDPNKQAVLQLSLAGKSQLSPAEYVSELQKKGSIQDSRGSSETVGDYEAWIGKVAVAQEGSTQPLVLQLGVIRQSPTVMFQFIGQSKASDAGPENAMFATMRSFKKLTDPARINVQPARLRVVRAGTTGDFGEVVKGYQPSIDAEEIAVLNNAQLDQTVRTGEPLKVVSVAPAK